jgi:acetate---CoA ligase (ADP-forming)
MLVHSSNHRPFGELAPMLDPRSVAVVGASDRDGNVGGLAVRYLQKFGYRGPIWPVNAGRTEVAGLRCHASLAALPAVPDLVIIAVPAEAVYGVVKECIAATVPAAIVWSGGFAEAGPEGVAMQRRLEELCRNHSLKLCGPNCIGIINSSNGLTASFSSLLTEIDALNTGHISMVSQSGGISVNAMARAQELGLGFRLVISCGNEAVLGVHDFIEALADDAETRVIAVYVEGLSDPVRFVRAIAKARAAGKFLVFLKGGGGAASARAAMAHTGKLAGSDRVFDAILREFAAIRVYSIEEMLDVSLLITGLPTGKVLRGGRVLLSSFGGGSGVIGTDQCEREGLSVPALDSETRKRLEPIFSSLGSSANPVDLTPGSMTNAKLRANLLEVMKILADAPDVDLYLLLSAGFGALAPELVKIYQALQDYTEKPVVISWLSAPSGVAAGLASSGVRVFDEHARAIRAAGHLARFAANTNHQIRHRPEQTMTFDWSPWVSGVADKQVLTEDAVAGILAAAGLAVAPGQTARTSSEALQAARQVGYPVAIKALSEQITHRAAVGLVALGIRRDTDVEATFTEFVEKAEALGATLDGLWVQHMAQGNRELLITAFRDRDFGVMIGCGLGGGMTEIIDDVVFSRAPIDRAGAYDLLGYLRSLHKAPDFLTVEQRQAAARFIAHFSALAASAPWQEFTLEINPLKLSATDAAAVDGLLIIG